MHFSLMNGWKREGIRKNWKNLKILEFSHFEGEKLNNPTCSLHLLKAMVCGEVPALKVLAKISGASQSQAVRFRVAALNEVAGLFDEVFGCWIFRESCRALEELSLEYWHVPRGQRRAEIWSILVRQPDFHVFKGEFGAIWKIHPKC